MQEFVICLEFVILADPDNRYFQSGPAFYAWGFKKIDLKMIHKPQVDALSFGTIFSHGFEIDIDKEM